VSAIDSDPLSLFSSQCTTFAATVALYSTRHHLEMMSQGKIDIVVCVCVSLLFRGIAAVELFVICK